MLVGNECAGRPAIGDRRSETWAMPDELGQRFARALAEKDRAGLLDLLDPHVDFRGLTPNQVWEADSAVQLVDDIILGAWFEDDDHIDALEDVQLGSVIDRHRVSYRLGAVTPDGPFVVEQQAYFDTSGDRITWLRILCSGFQAVDAPLPGS
jgi:hypothetical protein